MNRQLDTLTSTEATSPWRLLRAAAEPTVAVTAIAAATPMSVSGSRRRTRRRR